MRILVTGGSSFTGYWFVRELTRAGHTVTATVRNGVDAYRGVRAERVAALSRMCNVVFGCTFGDEQFCSVVQKGDRWDLLCHHAAEVGNYKSANFDIAGALMRNVANLPAVLNCLRERDCQGVLATGSVFEPGEGAGSQGLPGFSPYGVSKRVTADVCEYYTLRSGMRFGKFVITNPFGPYEEPRFTSYLARTWLAQQPATVATPQYVRDNIHVSLLARAYAAFAVQLLAGKEPKQRLCPSGYVESQGGFAQRFAVQMRSRLGLPCELVLSKQTDFPEPVIRIGTDPPDAAALGWSEQETWDELAEYYRSHAQATS